MFGGTPLTDWLIGQAKANEAERAAQQVRLYALAGILGVRPDPKEVQERLDAVMAAAAAVYRMVQDDFERIAAAFNDYAAKLLAVMEAQEPEASGSPAPPSRIRQRTHEYAVLVEAWRRTRPFIRKLP